LGDDSLKDLLDSIPDPLAEIMNDDGTLKPRPTGLTRRRLRRETFRPEEWDVDPDDPIVKDLVGDPTPPPAETLAHDGNSDKGHTEKDRPETATDDQW